MFVSSKTYDRAVRVAEELRTNAEQWKTLSNDLLRQLDDSKRRHAITETDACNQASRANDLYNRVVRLEARLAVFTAPRKRGLGGRFVSSKGGVA